MVWEINDLAECASNGMRTLDQVVIDAARRLLHRPGLTDTAESLLVSMPQLAYAGAVDHNGYCYP